MLIVALCTLGFERPTTNTLVTHKTQTQTQTQQHPSHKLALVAIGTRTCTCPPRCTSPPIQRTSRITGMNERRAHCHTHTLTAGLATHTSVKHLISSDTHTGPASTHPKCTRLTDNVCIQTASTVHMVSHHLHQSHHTIWDRRHRQGRDIDGGRSSSG